MRSGQVRFTFMIMKEVKVRSGQVHLHDHEGGEGEVRSGQVRFTFMIMKEVRVR